MKALLLLTLVANVAAFKFLANFKAASLIPRPSAMLKKRKAKLIYGDKKLAVITDASSSFGLQTAAELLRTEEYHVFGLSNDLEKMRAAAGAEFATSELKHFTPLQVELSSFESVNAFCNQLDKLKLNRPISRLICNAAVYQLEAVWSTDGHAETQQVNFLSHFQMVARLLPGMTKSDDPRVVLVGKATAEEHVTVYPRADLSTLAGLKAGFKNPISMLDGFNYQGAKAYKDSKLCLSMLSTLLHDKYHKQTGIAFSTVYPGIDEPTLFEGKPPLNAPSPLMALQLVKPPAPVSAAVAAQRIFQVCHDPRCSKSGVHWSWLEGKAADEASKKAEDDSANRAGWETIYETEPSEQVLDFELSQELWRQSAKLTNTEWPTPNQPRSPCPTLVVIGAITKAMNAKEEAKRTLEGLEDDGKGGLKVRAAVIGGAGTVVDAVVGNTIGRAGKLAQEKLLGGQVQEALQGSFQETKSRSLDERIDRALGAQGMRVPGAKNVA